ncbi:MAG: hypothetical protein QNJ46_28740 [Leptolyngbyaceae cyanobacterium MO_188.B28]|nr:hypothetical protein [Leptolyngbyaceae cyanobacterium MO_188.B28]
MRVASVCTSLVMVASSPALGAANPEAVNRNPTASSAQTPTRPSLPGLITRQIQRDLADRLNVPFHSLEIQNATPHTWPDHCLGLARPAEPCQSVDIRGWRVKVRSTQQTWTYRSDRTAHRLRLEPLPGATAFSQGDFSAQIAQTLLETVSQQVQQPIDNLQVLQIQSAIWDGCLGVYTPNQICPETEIAGFRVLIGDGQRPVLPLGHGAPPTDQTLREWVYHLNEDGSQIIPNMDASDLEGTVKTLFSGGRLELSAPAESESQVIFQSEIYHFVGGYGIVAKLTVNGTVVVEQVSRYPQEKVELIAEHQISPEELTRFEALLQQQKFANFNRMAYATMDPSVAFDSNITLLAPGTSASIGSDFETLPPNLQAVVEAWVRLARLRP